MLRSVATTRLVFLAAPLLALSACSGDPAPSSSTPTPAAAAADEPTTISTYSAEQFFDTTTVFLAADRAFSHDGSSLLMSSDQTGVFNAWQLPLDGGTATALTDSDDNAVFAVSWFPHDNRMLYTYDSGGNELNHLIVRELDGSSRDLTPGDDLKASFLGWLDDGSAFFATSTERDPSVFDVYRYDATSYERELVFENPGLQVSAVSGDGRWLAFVRPRTSADSDLLIVDLTADSPESQLITEHDGNIGYDIHGFTPDSERLVYSTNEVGEFAEAWQYDLATGDKSTLVSAEWDVVAVAYSPDGRYRVELINADARNDVRVVDMDNGLPAELPELPDGDLQDLRFMQNGDGIAVVVNADSSPSNIYVADSASAPFVALTDTLNPAIDAGHLVDSTVVRYPSFDELEIPAVLYKPKQASAENPVPALVWVHGGPGGQSRVGYSAVRQHLVNHGYALLAANNRGSSGYGKTFFHLDDRRHGEEDLQDIVYGRRYLESLDWVDSDRVGVIGGSYGGYMVAAALAFEPEEFDVGINIFGVTNWVRTLESIPPWWEAFKEALYDEMGDPATDAERHRRISPLFHADNIVRPLLVVQGANDPRVLQVESDELVAAVQANEVPVEYVVFPDEGHGFRKRTNRITASEAYLSFLNTHLKGTASPSGD